MVLVNAVVPLAELEARRGAAGPRNVLRPGSHGDPPASRPAFQCHETDGMAGLCRNWPVQATQISST